VGMEARRLLVVTDINEAALGSGFIPGTNAQGFTFQQASRPYFSQYPNFGVINQISSSGTSNYNSLQVTFRTKVWHGVSTQFNYTWAHSLDEITAYVGAIPQDSTNFKNDYGNSDFDIRHNFSGYIVYDIPGSHWGPGWLTHGWRLGTIVWLFGFAMPAAFASWSMIFINYIQHVHADPWSEHNHSRNFVSKLGNFLVFNNGYHTAHHESAGLHWSKLAGAHAKVAHLIHPELNQSSIFGYIFRAYLLGVFSEKYRTMQIGRAPYDPPDGSEIRLETAAVAPVEAGIRLIAPNSTGVVFASPSGPSSTVPAYQK